MARCLCGGQAHIESIISLKTIVSGKPIYTWRVVCNTCGEGMYDLRGSPTKEKAMEKFDRDMQSIKHLAREFNVTPEYFLKTINR
jgi:hypothetical protein